jgi:sugar/nucleoside kinase (ribokinase family)
MSAVHKDEREDRRAARDADLVAASPPESFDVITLGEPLVCLTAPQGRLSATRTLTRSMGGAEANVAIGLARLGLRPAYISRVGADPFGDEIVRTLRGEGVDVSRVGRSASRPTGLMIKETRSPDDVHVYYYRQGSAASELADGLVADTRPRSRHAHVTGITMALGPGPAAAVHELIATAHAWGATVSFDPNFRLKLWSVEDAVAASSSVLPAVDDLLLSEGEALALTGTTDVKQALDALVARGVPRVVIRRGPLGALGACGEQRLEVPAEVVRAVDTVGAGDAFTTGYLFELLRAGSFAQAMATGNWVAAHVVAHAGDYEGLPYRAEYEGWRTTREAVQR